MLKTAVEVGDGWNMSADQTVDMYKGKLAIINEWCKKLGKNPESFAKTWDGHVVISKNQREFDEKIAMLKKANASGEALIGLFERRGMLQHSLSGTPDRCIKKLRELVALGISHFSLYSLEYPSFDGINAFAEQVLPEFH